MCFPRKTNNQFGGLTVFYYEKWQFLSAMTQNTLCTDEINEHVFAKVSLSNNNYSCGINCKFNNDNNEDEDEDDVSQSISTQSPCNEHVIAHARQGCRHFHVSSRSRCLAQHSCSMCTTGALSEHSWYSCLACERMLQQTHIVVQNSHVAPCNRWLLQALRCGVYI